MVRAIPRWCLLLACSACLPSTGSSWPNPNLDLAFVYRISADGSRSIERVSTKPGDTRTVALAADEEIYLVGATAASLEASYASFSRDDSMATASLELDLPDEDALCIRYGTLDPIQNRLRIPLVQNASLAHLRLWRFDPAAGAWQTVSELPNAEALHLHYTPGACLAGQRLTHEPFTAASLPSSPGAGLERLSATRAVVADRGLVSVVDRERGMIGHGWTSDNLPHPPMGTGRWDITALDLAPGGTGGRRRAIVGLSYVKDPIAAQDLFSGSMVAALTIDDSGVSFEGELYRTEDLPSEDSRLQVVVVGPDGAWFAAADGFLVTASSSASVAQRWDAPQITPLVARWGGNPNAPHWLFGRRGDLWQGNVFGGPQALEHRQIPIQRSFRAVALGPGDRDSFIAATEGPALGRIEADAWTQLPAWLPEEAQRCAATRQCGRLVAGDNRGSRPNALAYDASRDVVVFGLDGCSAVFALDLVDGCSTLTALRDPIVFVREVSDLDQVDGVLLKLMESSGDELWLGGVPGLLEVLRFE